MLTMNNVRMYSARITIFSKENLKPNIIDINGMSKKELLDTVKDILKDNNKITNDAQFYVSVSPELF